MKNSAIMKTNFNKFWKGIAVAAVLSASALGYAEASKLQTATHYNARSLTDPNQNPDWQPIVPGSPQDLNTCTPTTRPCKAIKESSGAFTAVAFGYL